jgi:hypothetical protein
MNYFQEIRYPIFKQLVPGTNVFLTQLWSQAEINCLEFELKKSSPSNGFRKLGVRETSTTIRLSGP